jgi:hypothetical protein
MLFCDGSAQGGSKLSRVVWVVCSQTWDKFRHVNYDIYCYRIGVEKATHGYEA